MSRKAQAGPAVPGIEGGPMPDPRGIRVTLAASSASADLPPLVLEPPEIPLGPAARVTGRGILGGTAPVRLAPSSDTDGRGHVLLDGAPEVVLLVPLDAERAILVRGEGDGDSGSRRDRVLLLAARSEVGIARGVVRREIVVDGWRIEVEVEPAARAALRERARRGREETGHSGPSEVRAIIPGAVISVSVAPGDDVTAGQQLLVVEAMKMQNELRAPRDGTIERVAVAAGETIEVGDLLLVIN
jgi:biotin carboxyl carrier protein